MVYVEEGGDQKYLWAFSICLCIGVGAWDQQLGALQFGINWCLNNDFQYNIAESDSKLLVGCVKRY